MLGLRTRECDKFKTYWNIVQSYARKQGCVFFLDSGEGRDFETSDLDVEDVSGWLIPEDRAGEFNSLYMKRAESDTKEWCDYYCFAVWELNGNDITVSFKFYENYWNK